MIDPNQLTIENGFVEGCVIEYETDSEYPATDYFDASFIDSATTLVSIRPLTGHMAIWNHAPEWAVCAQVREMGVSWEYNIPEWWDGVSPVISMRPFWVTKETK